MRIHFSLTLMFILSLFLFSCGSDPDEKKDEKNMEEISEDLNKTAEKLSSGEIGLGQAMSQMQQAMAGGKSVTPVNFRKLKALLPEKIKGMERTNIEGEKTGGFGIKISTASAKYRDSNGRLKISIVDMGTMKGIAGMATAAWMNAEIDRESENEIEQTFSFRGNKAYKKYNKRSQHGEIAAIIAARFMVSVKGTGLPFSRYEEALDEIPLKALEEMRNEGVK